MTVSPDRLHRAQPRPVANTLNAVFRWLLIGSAAVFALATSGAIALPHPASIQFASLINWAAGLSFLAGAAALLGVGITEIFRGSSAAEPKTNTLQGKPTPGVRLPLTFCVLGLLLAIYYGLHAFWWNPLAAAPGYTLSEIYSLLKETNQFSLLVVVVWGFFVALLLAALPNVHEWLRGMASYSTKRAIGFCSLAVAIACFLLFLGWGWHMGVGLADTFITTGGEHSPTAVPFGVATLVLGALGIYGLFVPARTR
ncbi:hypothetical protein [Rothia nasimurium]|uniref:hypothetical protein n=1 Tax=Rothia nasimurium TaxID=85336 RepID=UPI001F23ED14|nr:hypothetical protein [Rothia nasimurium]